MLATRPYPATTDGHPAGEPACYSAVKGAQAGSPATSELHHHQGHDLKLDIEGAEAAALRGMAGHLARRPLLAVSAYHRPADLWELPELIAELYPRPVLRLRQHGHHAFDTVLYATPE